MQLDSDQLAKRLVDMEELDFPADVQTYGYNLPQPVVFNEYVKPHVEKLIQRKAEESLYGKTTRDLSMGGSNIQQDVVRVFLGLYHVVYKYGGKEYSMWSTGDGQTVSFDVLPSDPQRQVIQAEKQQVAASIPDNNTGTVVSGLVACIIMAVLFFTWSFIGLLDESSELPHESLGELYAILVGLLFVVGAVLCGMMIPSVSKVGKERDKQRAKAQQDLNNFNTLLPNTIQRFKEQKNPLRGIYEGEVAGNAEAF